MRYKIREIDTNEEELQRQLALLPFWRRERALRYKFAQGRMECAVSYNLLQEMLQELGISDLEEFATGEHGKPQLTQHPEVHFNLSHCKQAVACAVNTEGPVGIDIESRGRFSDGLARYAMSEDEMRGILEAEDPDLEFTVLWTRKEALFKLLGDGITDDIKNILLCYPHVNIHTDIAEQYVLSIASL